MSVTSVIKLSRISKSFGHVLFVERPGLEAKKQEIEDLDSKYIDLVQEESNLSSDYNIATTGPDNKATDLYTQVG